MTRKTKEPVAWSKFAIEFDGTGYLNQALEITACRGPILAWYRDDIEKAIRICRSQGWLVRADTAEQRMKFEVEAEQKRMSQMENAQ